MRWMILPVAPKYEVSEFGQVRNATTKRHLTPFIDCDGYTRYAPYGPKGRLTLTAQRAVAWAFLGEPPTPKHQVAHWDNNRANNHYSNLRWATCKENQHDRIGHGTDPIGERHPRSKLTEEQVRDILRAKSEPGYRHRLGALYGVSHKTIDRLRGDKGYWAHVR